MDNYKDILELTCKKEDIAQDLLKICPDLTPDENNTMALAILCLDQIENHHNTDLVTSYIKYRSDFNDDEIRDMTNPDWLRGFIVFLSNKGSARQRERGHK